ncbi:MAG: hypothetical protein Q9208_007006 [Pyrenodesmia sp. 3 TL-2023]
MSSGLHPIERKIVENQRSSSQGLVCPYCAEGFVQEPRLWEHAKTLHWESLGLSNEAHKGQVRSQVREKALQKASNSTTKHMRNSSQPAPTFRDIYRPGSKVITASGQELRTPAPKDSSEKIEDLEKLSIGQFSSDAMPTPNPLKRRPVDGLESLRTDPKNSSTGRTGPSARHGKTLSVGPLVITDPDFARKPSAAMIDDYAKNFQGPIKQLYNPDLDDPKLRSSDPPRKFVEPTGRAHASPDPSLGITRPGEFPHTIVGPGSPSGPTTKNLDRPRSALTDKAVPLPQGDSEYSDDPAQPVEPQVDIIQESQPQIIRQPETRPISHDQLVVEVKGIYAGLVLVEQKCKEVDEKQSPAALEDDPTRKAPLSNEQWQALIALHKTLLHEHHDFFLASQHPSASPTLSKLAGKYSMPARMWRHGIHAFLEVLRYRLPASSDHMLAFIYIAYSMMALLYETVSAFVETWIECLGDLARYRMAIEEHDVQDREIWGGVARFWYSKAADKRPEIGRLYHHLAILARPNSLQQLSFYSRSLACLVPFISARSSIMTLFQPMLEGKVSSQHRLRTFEVAFIKIHANLFVHERPTPEVMELYENVRTGLLDDYIGRVTTRFREQGVSIAITNIAAIFEYGALGAEQTSRSIFRISFLEVWAQKLRDRETASGKAETALEIDEDKQKTLIESLEQQVAHPPSETDIASSAQLIEFAVQITFTVLTIVLQRPGDKNVFPIVHITFCFIWSLAGVEKLLRYVEQDVPWVDICSFLNALAKPDAMTPKIWAKTLPMPDGGVTQPLPEDYVMRGQLCALWYHPEGWFDRVQIDLEERSLEMPSMAASRVERILWLGMGIASVSTKLAMGC